MDISTETPEEIREEKTVYEFFLVSVLLKGAISLAEVFAGILVLFVPTASINALATLVVSVATALHFPVFITVHIAELFTEFTHGTAIFVSIYLLSRGLVKVFLIYALLKNKLWAYPASLIVLALFIFYQLYQIITTHSFIVVGITLFDLVVIYFIWREYQIVKMHMAEGMAAQPGVYASKTSE